VTLPLQLVFPGFAHTAMALPFGQISQIVCFHTVVAKSQFGLEESSLFKGLHNTTAPQPKLRNVFYGRWSNSFY